MIKPSVHSARLLSFFPSVIILADLYVNRTNPLQVATRPCLGAQGASSSPSVSSIGCFVGQLATCALPHHHPSFARISYNAPRSLTIVNTVHTCSASTSHSAVACWSWRLGNLTSKPHSCLRVHDFDHYPVAWAIVVSPENGDIISK
ncbi:hypothetical protein EV126DRAFT_15302 [Verticillium dahliae]|nr:hypothetical protein EV126DRAFT_15302 [Verticillium dahliae]